MNAQETRPPSSPHSSQLISMTLSTDAIDEQGFFDSRYTCDSDNSSPELRWENVPTATTGFALIAEDLDAPASIFTHWVVYNIPQKVHHLPAGIPPQESLPNGIRQGINGLGKLGYAGPCPPIGDRLHRYRFRLFALNSLPEVPHRIQKEDLLHAIDPHRIAVAEIIGKYRRVLQRAG
jgi:Raf kinase inhibitor-like YbhB/YbcL family protein